MEAGEWATAESCAREADAVLADVGREPVTRIDLELVRAMLARRRAP